MLDFTDIRAFGGSATQFYDAVHPTRENARRIIRRAVNSHPSASSRRARSVAGGGRHHVAAQGDHCPDRLDHAEGQAPERNP